MRVLVTGGAGFIGSAVCRLFVGELNMTVLNVDRPTYRLPTVLGNCWNN